MSATIPVVPSAPAEQPTQEPGFAPQPPAASAPQPPAASAAPTQWLSISALVLGIVSIFAGWTFVVPAAGLVLGILALKREPTGRTMAIWGIVLNSVLLAGGVLVALGALAFGLLALPFAFLPLGMF